MAQPHVCTADTIPDQLERLSGRLDRLVADARLGHPIPHEYDRQEEEAAAIADGLRDAYRRCARRPVNPPLGRSGSGYVW